MEQFLSNFACRNRNLISITTGATVACVTSLYLYHYYLSTPKKKEPPIKWSWIPILGHAFEMGQKPLELLKSCKNEYSKTDDIFGVIIAGKRFFLFANPLCHGTLFNNHTVLSIEEFHNEVLTKFFGVRPAILTTEVMNEDVMRSMWSKYLLSGKGLTEMTERMQNYLQQHISSLTIELKDWEGDMYKFIAAFVFEASLAGMFTPKTAKYPNLLESFFDFDDVFPLACAGCPVSLLSSAKKGRRNLLSSMQSSKKDCSTLIKKRWDYFDELARKGKLIDTDSTDMQLVMLWASVANTIPATFWLFYFLLQEASVDNFNEVQKELSSIVAKRKDVRSYFNIEELESMHFLDACITETLRLVSGSLIVRQVTENTTIKLESSGREYSFRKGDSLGMFPTLVHKDESLFPDSDSFNPKRWIVGAKDSKELKENVQGKLSLIKDGEQIQYGYSPFGAGHALCPGRRFSRNEMKCIIAHFFANFNMEILGEAKSNRPHLDWSRCGAGIVPPKSIIKCKIQSK